MAEPRSFSMTELERALPSGRRAGKIPSAGKTRRHREARPKPYDHPKLRGMTRGKFFGQEIVALKIARNQRRDDPYDLERSINFCLDELSGPAEFYKTNFDPKEPRKLVSEHYREFVTRGEPEKCYDQVAGELRRKLFKIFNERHVRYPVVVVDSRWNLLDFVTNRYENLTWAGTNFWRVLFLRFGCDERGLHFAPASYRPKVDCTLRRLAKQDPRLHACLSKDDGRPRCGATVPWEPKYVPKPLGIPAPPGTLEVLDMPDTHRMPVVICDLGSRSEEREARMGAEGLTSALHTAFQHKEMGADFYSLYGDELLWSVGCRKRETKQSISSELCGLICETLERMCWKHRRSWPLLVLNTEGMVIACIVDFAEAVFVPEAFASEKSWVIDECICIAYEDGCFFSAVPPSDYETAPTPLEQQIEDAQLPLNWFFVRGGTLANDPNGSQKTKLSVPELDL